MQETPAKALARTVYYEECLSKWLTPAQYRAGHHMLLLGADGRELPYFDQRCVPRSHLWSVENNHQTYRAQKHEPWGVNHYLGDVATFLRFALHTNNQFVHLNLDTEGWFRKQIDPAMTSILLFCCVNPETVVGTSTTVCRDEEMIWEGIKSLAVLFWLLPRETMLLVTPLYYFYAENGYGQPHSMMLRDLFWLRSFIENAVCVTELVDSGQRGILHRFTEAEDYLWRWVTSRKTLPLTMAGLQGLVNQAGQSKPFKEIVFGWDPICRVNLAEMFQLVYRGANRWSQRNYYFKSVYRHLARESFRDWLARLMQTFRCAPFVYINQDGKRHDFPRVNRAADASVDSLTLWRDLRLYNQFRPRSFLFADPRLYQSSIERIRRQGDHCKT